MSSKKTKKEEQDKNECGSESIFKLIKKFVNDLDEVAVYNNIIVPFNYLEFRMTKANFSINDQIDYYYHNCLIDILIKLYGRTLSDKFTLTSFLVGLMPKNVELAKLYANYSIKLNGAQKTLQIFYDYLSVNSIDFEHLWIL
jgi:hypothetical protein